MSDLTVSMILRLVDQVTGPMKPVLRGIREVQGAIGKSGEFALRQSQRIESVVGNQTRALKSQALGLTGIGLSMAASLKPAIDFEAAMASVRKVVSFKEETGIARLGKEMLDLSERIPFAADGLAEIVAAAGRAGLINDALPDDEKRAQLIAFAEAAAKMGTAFDISAGEAGDALAQWQAALGMGQDESLKFADALNYLANNMNTTEKNLIDIVSYVGAVAKTAGLTNTEIAALSAAISAAGASPERAATGLKNFTNALTRGASATKRQSEVFKELGFDSEAMAERMQVDAKGAILDVLEALKKLPAARQNAAIGDLFGEEAKGAIAPMLVNIDALRHAFDLVAEPGNYAGAMLKEFDAQAGTTAASLQLTLNSLKRISITLGTVFLPALNDVLHSVRDVLHPMAEWAQANPVLVTQIGQVVAMLVGLKVAMFAVRLVVVGLLSPLGKVLRILSWIARIGAFTNPFTLMVAGTVLLATVIYENWTRIVGFLQAKFDTVKAAFEQGFLRGMVELVNQYNPLRLLYDALQGLTLVAVEELARLAAMIHQSFEGIELYDAGLAMIQSLWDGAGALIGKMVAYLKAKLADIMPDWMQGAWNWAAGRDPNVAPAAQAAGQVPQTGVPDLSRVAPPPPRVLDDVPVLNTPRVPTVPAPVAGLPDLSRVAPPPPRVPEDSPAAQPPVDTRRARAPGSVTNTTSTTNVRVGEINVQAAPGMNETALARETASRIRQLETRRDAPLSDPGEDLR